MVTLNDIKQAAARIAPMVRPTPIEEACGLTRELGKEIFFKMECWQTTGSFKLRGAAAKLTTLSAAERARGILTCSAGNHGLAVAHCAAALGVDATIVVARSAARAKVEAIGRYPVTLIERGINYDEAERAARLLEGETERCFVSPYNDREVIAGQGTIALELLAQVPDLEALMVPVGGGGLLAGIAIAAKALNPRIKIYGVEPLASPSMTRALEAGRLTQIEEAETIADGLAGNVEPGSITFPIIQHLLDRMALVSEAAIRQAMARVAREEHVLIEGAAAAAVAALSEGQFEGQKIAAILTGRNVTFEWLREVLTEMR